MPSPRARAAPQGSAPRSLLGGGAPAAAAAAARSAEWTEVLRQLRARALRRYGAERFFSRPRGSGGERRDGGDEASEVVTNVAKGEKLKMKELWALKDKPVLYVKDDGSKEEVTLQQVIAEAREQDLAPVMVSGLTGNAMPVLKLMDVGRTRHDMQKKKRESSKKNTGSQSLKELRFGLHIDQNDLRTKMKQARTFLEKGHRVRIFMQLKGADYHRNQKQALTRLEEIADLVGDSGMQDGKPSISGHVVSTTLAPKPGGASSKQRSSEGGGSSKQEKGSDNEQGIDSEPSSPEEVAAQVCGASSPLKPRPGSVRGPGPMEEEEERV